MIISKKMSELFDKLKSKAVKLKNSHNLELLKAEENSIQLKKKFNKRIRSSIKFKMEACHNLLPDDKPPLDVLKEFIETINLPYESIIIELDAHTLGDNQDTPLVILAQQEDDEIRIYPFFKLNNGWNYMHVLSEDNAVYAVVNKNTFEGYVVGLNELEITDKSNQISNWLNKVAIRSVCNLLCALSCSNTRIDDSPFAPSATKNALRKSKKKLPLFEFKILTIDTGKNPSHSRSNQVTIGKHASPRVHLRRGHIRKLPNKNIWVNSCVVGDKSIGTIQKNYLIK